MTRSRARLGTGSGALAIALVAALIALVPGASGQSACTVTWDRGAGTNSWHDATNWSANTLPGAGDVVCIPTGFSTVVHTQAVTTDISGLELRSPLSVSGGGKLHLNGAQPSVLVATITITAATLVSGGTVVQAGTVNVGGTGGAIDNRGLWDVQGDGDVFSGGATPSIRNGGTLRKSAGTGETLISIPIDNDGAIEARSGSLRLLAGGPAGKEATGTFDVGPGAILDFGGGTFTLGASANVGGSGNGEARFSGGAVASAGGYTAPNTRVSGGAVTLDGPSDTGTLTISSGTLNANDALSPSTLTLTGGTLGGSGDIVVPQASWSTGTQSGTGTTRVTGTLDLPSASSKSLNRRLELPAGATAALSGAGALILGGSAELANSGTLTVSTDADILWNGGSPALRNAGTLRKSAGGGETLISVAVDNDGTLAAASGSIRLSGGSPSSSEATGAFDVSASGVLDFGGGSFTLGASSTVTGTGTAEVRFSGATVSVTGPYSAPATRVTAGTATLNGSSATDSLVIAGGTLNANDSLSPATFTQSAGSLGGSGTVESPQVSWTGGLQSAPGTTRATGTLDVAGASSKSLSRTLELTASTSTTISGIGNVLVGTNGLLDNAGTIAIADDTDLLWNGGSPLLRNTGTLRKASGSGETLLSVATDNDGSVEVASGSLRLTGGGIASDEQAGDFAIAGGARLELGGGSWALASSAQISGPASSELRISAGALTSGHDRTLPPTRITGGTLTLDGHTTMPSLAMSGGVLSGAGTLDCPTIAWTGGTQSGAGLTRANGTLELSGASSKVLSRRLDLPAGATATLTGLGNLFVGGGGALDNAGTLEFASDADIVWNGGSAELRNSGLVRKSAGTAETLVSVALDNDGTVDVASGTVRLSGGGLAANEQAGAFHIAPGTAIDWSGGAWTLGPSASVAGPQGAEARFSGATVTSAASLVLPATRLSSGTLTLAAQASARTLTQSGGILTGAGTLTSPQITWSAGTQSGSGGTVATGTLDLTGASSKVASRPIAIEPGATATLAGAGSIFLGGAGVIDNRGSFDVAGDADVHSNGGTPRFLNQGVLRKSAGTADTTIGVELDNKGTVRVDSGTIHASGAFANYSQTTDVLTGGRYELAGTFRFTGADVTLNEAAIVLVGPGGRVLDQAGANGLRNLARNGGGGRLELLDGVSLARTGRLTNAGAVVLSGASELAVSRYVQTAGSTLLADQAARLRSTIGITELDGGTLAGNGTVDSDLESAGEVSPGGSTPTLTVVGDYAQLRPGRLRVDIAGSGTHDRLEVGGEAKLDGELEIVTAAGYVPAAGERFDVLGHGSADGRFRSFTGREASPGLYYNPAYDQASTALVVGDLAPARLSIADVTVHEGDSGQTEARFRVTASESRNDLAVDYETADGTAASPGDFTAASGTLVLGSGELEGEIVVQVNGDRAYEGAEHFTVLLSNPSAEAVVEDGEGTGTIADDDPAPTVTIGDVAVEEGDPTTAATTAATLTLTLSEPSEVPVAVAYSARSGSATENEDYVPASGRLTFAPGAVEAIVTVDVLTDHLDEPDEDLLVVLGPVDGAVLADAEGRALVVDDDDQCESLLTRRLGTDAICALVRG